MIPELRALAENRPDVVGQFLALLPRGVAEHFGIAPAGVQDAGQHLDGGGFPRAVRADEAEQFARFHFKRQVAHRFDVAVLRL